MASASGVACVRTSQRNEEMIYSMCEFYSGQKVFSSKSLARTPLVTLPHDQTLSQASSYHCALLCFAGGCARGTCRKGKKQKRAHVWQAHTSVDRPPFFTFTAKIKRRQAPAWSDDSGLTAQLLMNEVWIPTSHCSLFSSSKHSPLKGSHCVSKI